MCFRPPTAAKALTCPQCGALNPASMKTCIKCKADLTQQEKDLRNEEK